MIDRELIKKILREKRSAKESIIKLYQNNLNEREIIELLTLGQLGKDRRLVKRKNANIIYDKIISAYLLEKRLTIDKTLSQNTNINSKKLFKIYFFSEDENEFLLTISQNTNFIYEYKELYFNNNSVLDQIHSIKELEQYIPKSAGAFFSTLLGLLESQLSINNKTGILLLRIMKRGPLGSTKLRNFGRKIAKNKIYQTTQDSALINYINKNLPKFTPLIEQTKFKERLKSNNLLKYKYNNF